MNSRKEKEQYNAVVYLVEDYRERNYVIQDLGAGKRVVIISTAPDVLAFYGLLLEQHGQYNLYKVDNFDEVDEEFIETVADTDETKEDAILYVGKPLSQLVSETIDTLQLTDEQARLMSVCKEILKSNNDIKTEVTVSRLNEKLKTQILRAETAEKELNELKEGVKDAKNSTQYIKSTLNLDAFLSDTKVMYVKEFNYVPYFDSFIRSYVKYLEEIKHKRVELIIFDEVRFDIYPLDKYLKMESSEEFMSNRNAYIESDKIVVSKQNFPDITASFYKAYCDYLIIVDRLVNKLDLVSGVNVHKYAEVSNNMTLNYLISQPKLNYKLITSERLTYKDGIVLSTINHPITNQKEELYWYSQWPNKGEDKRKMFDILDEINNTVNKVKVKL